MFNGDRGQRTYLFTSLPGLSALNLRLEPYGDREGPVRHNMNFRVSRTFSMAHQQNIRLELDALNALNTNVAWGRGVPGISYASGPNFGNATQIVAPRIFRVGVIYSF